MLQLGSLVFGLDHRGWSGAAMGVWLRELRGVGGERVGSFDIG